MSSPPTLTKGAILRLMQATGDWLEGPPRLQLIAIKRLPSQNLDPNVPERFRLIVSDGETYCQAMLKTEMNCLVDRNILERYCVFTLRQFGKNVIQGKGLLIVLNIDENDVTPWHGALGSPVRIDQNLMANANGANHWMISKKMERPRSPVISRGDFSDHLSCSICLKLLTHPYAVLPCLHTFDRECLLEWWKDNDKCPLCNTTAESGRFAFQINGILQRYIERSEGFIGPVTSPNPVDTDIIYPSGVQDRMDVDEGEEEIETVWPCPSCIPDNDTGFTCTVPIPIPEDVNTPPPTRGARRARLLTSDGQPRVAGAMQHRHCSTCTAYLPVALPIQCLICTEYSCSSIDREGECPNDPPTVLLGGFGSYRMHLRTLDDLDIITPPNTPVHDISQALGMVWRTASSRLSLNSNAVERDRFIHHIVNRNINLSEAILEMIDIEVHITGRMQSDRRGRRDTPSPEPGATDGSMAATALHDGVNQTTDQSSRRIGPLVPQHAPTSSMTGDVNHVSAGWKENPNTRVCERCITRIVEDQIHRWWERERSRGSLDPSIASLSNCWYGRECRTQTHSMSHAERYNHVCDNTIMARGRGFPRA